MAIFVPKVLGSDDVDICHHSVDYIVHLLMSQMVSVQFSMHACYRLSTVKTELHYMFSMLKLHTCVVCLLTIVDLV